MGEETNEKNVDSKTVRKLSGSGKELQGEESEEASGKNTDSKMAASTSGDKTAVTASGNKRGMKTRGNKTSANTSGNSTNLLQEAASSEDVGNPFVGWINKMTGSESTEEEE